MSVPDWWEALLLAGAALRTWRLLALDTVLSRPRMRVLARVSDGAIDFVFCPWCLGWWVTLVWWAGWLAAGTWAVGIAVPLALSAAVGMAGDLIHDDEGE